MSELNGSFLLDAFGINVLDDLRADLGVFQTEVIGQLQLQLQVLILPEQNSREVGIRTELERPLLFGTDQFESVQEPPVRVVQIGPDVVRRAAIQADGGK